jgi:BTB/POZ domain
MISHRFGSEPTVAIRVGSPPEDFHVHKSFLCNVSPFFRAALEGQFKESTDGILNLPENKPETFERLLGWLYFNQYDMARLVREKNDIEYWNAIIDDHVFADKAQLEEFQNEIIKQAVASFQSHHIRSLNLGSVLKLYTDTHEANPLRRLAVAMYECVDADWFQKPNVAESLRKASEFAAELVLKFAGNGRKVRNYQDLVAEDFYGQNGNRVES